ncbi:hypothetical protein HU200_066411 [Digitaria exilis]|uniref:Uncharacterized protein n=1 Tax=Digitaria exilis TaxID=1010633 RepID=A0A835DTV0_9POAL|nr:hypothetical protein HU200_066411 [Digitaria exilis]
MAQLETIVPSPRQEIPSSTASKPHQPPPAPFAVHQCPAVIPLRRRPPSSSAPSSAHLMRPGTAVGVRTRTTKLKTGKDDEAFVPPTTAPPSCAHSSSASDTTATAGKKEMQPAPRLTTAGKSLRLIRSLWPELQRQAHAAFPG